MSTLMVQGTYEGEVVSMHLHDAWPVLTKEQRSTVGPMLFHLGFMLYVDPKDQSFLSLEPVRTKAPCNLQRIHQYPHKKP